MRAPYVDKSGIKKGAWSEEEDQKLRDYILRYGHWNWRLLPKYAGLARCGKSCRLRWLNYLKPGVKLGNFSKEEEELIARLHDEYGNKWSLIATSLPGRTDNEIKNYWHTRLKKRGKAEKTTSPSEKPVQNSAQSINYGYRSQAASCVTTSEPAPKLPRKVENLQSYDVHILESSSGSSNSRSLARPVKWDPDDHSASSSLSSVHQPIIGAETRDGRMEDVQDQRDERGSSSYSFAELPESFWTEQLLMATSYSPDGGFASMPLEDESFLQGYLFS